MGGAASATQAPAQGLIEPLSRREREVLQLIAAGHSNPRIAARLVISIPTVKRHITNILANRPRRSSTAGYCFKAPGADARRSRIHLPGKNAVRPHLQPSMHLSVDVAEHHTGYIVSRWEATCPSHKMRIAQRASQ